MAKAKQSKALSTLRRRLVAAGITHVRIARRARVTPGHVCNVLRERYTSARVVAAARHLLWRQDSKGGGNA